MGYAERVLQGYESIVLVNHLSTFHKRLEIWTLTETTLVGPSQIGLEM